MYIIPKEKKEKIELKVKPDFLKNIDRIVKQGISDAVEEVETGIKIKFDDPDLVDWCKNLGKDLKDSRSKIFYKKITEAHPNLLLTIYEIFRNEYNYKVVVNGKEYYLFEEHGLGQLKKIQDFKMVRKFLEKCFPYNKFTSKDAQYDAYKYCKAMDINVCVYCNAQLTHTVVRRYKKIIRPQIDHFFPQSRFPMFALSFYNMIPACQTCNRIKRDVFCDLSEVYHPYVDDCADFQFRWRYNKIDVVCGPGKAENTAEVLHTKDVYGIYVGIAEKIVEKVQDYDLVYIEDIMKLMNKHRPKDRKLDKEEVIRKVYDYVSEEECFDTPLGEMRHDILVDRFEKAYKLKWGL